MVPVKWSLYDSLVAFVAVCLIIGLVLWGWDNMTPWGTKAQLNRKAAEATQLQDDLTGTTTQAAQDRAIAGATIQHTRDVIVIQERANEAIRQIEADKAAGRDPTGSLISFLCGSELYAADPECNGLADPD